MLDVAYGAEQDGPNDVSHFPYEQQRQLISGLLEQSPLGKHDDTQPKGQAIPSIRKTPEELANEIRRLHRDVGSVLGSHWNYLDTNWKAIAPAVLWWLDVCAEASAGHITGGAVSHLQDLTRGTGTGGVQRDWLAQAELLREELEGL